MTHYFTPRQRTVMTCGLLTLLGVTGLLVWSVWSGQSGWLTAFLGLLIWLNLKWTIWYPQSFEAQILADEIRRVAKETGKSEEQVRKELDHIMNLLEEGAYK